MSWFTQEYQIPLLPEWARHATSQDEFRTWIEVNNFTPCLIEKGHPVKWDRFPFGKKCGARMMVEKWGNAYRAVIRGWDDLGKIEKGLDRVLELSIVNKNINLAMAECVNQWNREVCRRWNGVVTANMIENSLMTPCPGGFYD